MFSTGKLTYDVANGKADSNVGFSTVEESDLGQKPVTRGKNFFLQIMLTKWKPTSI